MKSAYFNLSVTKYLEVLSSRTPVPGGGSAAAMTGALGSALLLMAARYSQNRNASSQAERRIAKIIREGEAIKQRFIELIDLDAQAYQEVVASRHSPLAARRKALRQAKKIPQEVCRLSYKAVTLAPYLVQDGNKNLLSDVEAAVELLMAAYNTAHIFTK